MIFWQGAGIVVFVFLGVYFVSINALVSKIWGDDYYSEHTWPMSLAFVLSAVSCWYLGRYLHKKGARTVVDKETGEELILEQKHTCMFVKVEYWAFIYLVFWGAMYFAK